VAANDAANATGEDKIETVLPQSVFNNYFSIGSDAYTALKVSVSFCACVFFFILLCRLLSFIFSVPSGPAGKSPQV
jgi:hypothetical protein